VHFFLPVSRLLACLAAPLCAVILTAPAGAQDRAAPSRPAEALRSIEPHLRTGVLYDRVLPLAHVERLDGTASAPAIDAATWRQAYDELRRASLAAPPGPDLAALDAGARAARRTGLIPLALFDRAFERVRPGALDDGSLRAVDGRLVVTGTGLPVVRSRAIAAAALTPRTHRGGDAVFALDAERFLSDDPAPPRELAIDFADGRGFRPVRLGERVHASYPTTGRRTLVARLTRADGSQSAARFTLDVAALATPSPDDTLQVTATVPYQGQYGTGEAFVYLAPGHTAIENPAIVIEGFDLDNSMDWDELYALLNQQDMIENLRSDGLDAVVLDFTDATLPIEENSFVVAALLQQVESLIAPQTTVALVGASMGGLCSRYALAWLESHGIPHRVRTWISYDGAQSGADVPLGLQYWINFFSGQSVDAAAFLAVLQSPAARELLFYHFASTSGTTARPDPLRDSLQAHLTAAGDWPTLTRRVAIADGSGSRQNQGFLPGAQLIRYEYSSLLVTLKGDVWALPDQVSGMVFDGSLRILFSTTTKQVTVAGTRPWDGAPGGYRASMTQLDTTAAPYGDVVALHPSHCFIPTISALALATSDPFFDIAGAPDLLALTPFDAVYYSTENLEHVEISPEAAVWIRDEIEQGLVAVPGDGPSAGAGPRLLAGSPNPFALATRLRFSLAQAGPVDLRVFDVRGREVRSLVRETRGAGSHTVTWDGRDARGGGAPAGIYFVRLETAGQALARRIVKLD
jgi:hypothetical protein